MIRRPQMSDVQFIYECYQDWPITLKKGLVDLHTVVEWVRRWIKRADEICFVLDDNGPKGLILYTVNDENGDHSPLGVGVEAVVHNIVVHPNERGKGYFTQLTNEVWAQAKADGITKARFEARAGGVADITTSGKVQGAAQYKPIGTVEGETGTLVLGEFSEST